MNIRLALACISLLSIPLIGQQSSALHLRVVRASGEAVVNAKPDRAQISVGVQTLASSAQAAAVQNATETTTVLNALKQVVGASGDIKTNGYSITPQYDYAGGKSQLRGYQASNTVEVTMNDLAMVSKVIDVASGAGANNINSVSFSLKNPEPVRTQALKEASRRARAEAETIAEALGLKVVGVLEAQTGEQSTPIRPTGMNLATGRAFQPAVPTPIEAGDLEIRATVTVTLEVQ